MVVDTDNLWTVGDIAEYKGVTPQAVANWRARDPKFPPALFHLGDRPVYDKNAIIEWEENR